MPEYRPRVDLSLDGRTWTPITGDVLTEDGITASRGSADRQALQPGRVDFTLRNRDGRYSPRNPLSPYYGQLSRNTPTRVTIDAGSSALWLPGGPTDRASTPGVAALDTAGDLDVRVELEVPGGISTTTEIIGRSDHTDGTGYAPWILRFLSGTRLDLLWRPTNTSSLMTATSTASSVPYLNSMRVLRVLLDVDNGAGGWTCTFYHGETMDGPWTVLGTPVSGTGVTSIYAPATAEPLCVGAVGGITSQQITGRVTQARVYRAGTLVAAPDFRAWQRGAASYTDPAGRVWSLAGAAEISGRRLLAGGEVAEWPVRWGTSGRDVTSSLSAAGVLRRLGQGQPALPSPMRRTAVAAGPVAYWPLEDGIDTQVGGSPIDGVGGLRVKGLEFGADSSLAGSGPLPRIKEGGRLSANLPGRMLVDRWHAEVMVKIPQAPAGDRLLLEWGSTVSAAARLQLIATPVGPRFQALNTDGEWTSDSAHQLVVPALWGQWVRWQVFAEPLTASTHRITARWILADGAVWSWTTATITGRSRLTSVAALDWNSDLAGTAIGHLIVMPTPGSDVYGGGVTTGYTGETAVNRIIRVTHESTPVPMAVYDGDFTMASELCGPQPISSFLDVLKDCEAVDGGVLFEPKTGLTLAYRDRATLYNQPVALTLDYREHGLSGPLDPVDDDQGLVNAMTVSRSGGGSARAVVTEGPLSTQAPPTGVGTYDDSVTLNLYSDEQAERIAWWLVHLGTVDEARYPQVRILMHRAPARVVEEVLALQLGDRAQLVGLPEWMPPGPVDLLVRGIRHQVTDQTWEVILSCSPGSPWTVGVLEDPVLGRADTDGTELASAVTATATALPVTVTAGPAWITAPAPIALDRFPAAVTGGWGTAEVGGAWAWSGGAAADYSAAAGIAQHAHPSRAVFRITTLPVSLADVDETVLWSTPTTPAGDSHYVWLMARRASDATFLAARVQIQPSGVPLLTVRDRIGGTETSSGAATLAAITPGAWYRLRLQVTGTTARARCWVDGTPEPSTWQATWTTAITAAGAVGVRSLVPATSTAPLPVAFSFREFTARPYSTSTFGAEFPWDIRLGGEVCTVTGITGTGPAQTMTVIRAVNGVRKGHAAGTAVSLATPSVVAL
jgi:hypothetical protein